MIDNLLFSLNATVPIFLLMVLGYILFNVHFIDEGFVKMVNKFVFNIALPVQLFRDMASVDIRSDFDGPYVLFCALVTIVSFVAVWFLARLLMRRQRHLVGEFVQGCYRSSAAVLGVAFIQNIYGCSGLSGLMILGCVPLYNIFAVLVLTVESPQMQQEQNLSVALRKSLVGIVTNPLIIGVLLGTLAGWAGLRLPPMADKTLASIAALTTPLALIALGAGFKWSAAKGYISLTTIATVVKLLVFPALFLPLAAHYGFTGQKLVGIIIMLGSITTPSSYVMARQLGHEGTLTASICVLTTLFSSFTLTFWLFLSRCLGWT